MPKELEKLFEIVKKMNIAPLKKLGQNFLFDETITERIAKISSIKDSNVLEIGPGPGGLTRSILKLAPKKFIAIEPDIRVIPILEGLKDNFDVDISIIEGDALKVDFSMLFGGEKFKVLANLPYYVATEILIRLLYNYKHIESMTMMFQKEVAQRIVSTKDSKEYGRLSIISQSLFDTKIAFSLPPGCFYPPPKIYSSVVHFTPKEQIIDFDIKKLEFVTKQLFANRRKKIRKALLEIRIQENDFSSLDITGEERAENLTVEQFINLSKFL